MPTSIDYDHLNRVVNETFFSGRYDGLPVYLDLEDKIAEELAHQLSVDKQAVASTLGVVVEGTLKWDQRADIYAAHPQRLEEWAKAPPKDPPPFSALLLCLSVAAAR